MNEHNSIIMEELEKLENAVDRLISDNKILGLELETRDKQISQMSETIKSSGEDLTKVKERIAKLLLDKK